MKETGIIMSGNHPTLILEGLKTQTRRVITKRNSEVGEGRVDWDKFDFYQETYLNDRLKKIMADGAESGSIADISLKDNGRAPLPWMDNSVPHWQYLHVPYNWAENGTIFRIYPKWEVGDRLWVKETYATEVIVGGGGNAHYDEESEYWLLPRYKADGYDIEQGEDMETGGVAKWCPSLFMPRWASRITLEITEVRVERLQEITEEDAKAEGFASLFPKLDYQLTEDATPSNPRVDISTLQFTQNSFLLTWEKLNAKRGYGWDKNPWVWVIGFDLVGARLR